MGIRGEVRTECSRHRVRLVARLAGREAGRIHQVEQAALKSGDIAERINEPVNSFSRARAAVRLTARAARKLRK